MIRVTVELISAIHPSRNEVLGIAEIANDGTGDLLVGNYTAKLSKRGEKVKEVWRQGRVAGFRRKAFGAWDLLFLSLRSALGPERIGRIGGDGPKCRGEK